MSERSEPTQYFSATPTTASEPVTAELRLPDLSLDLVSDRGVFARGRIDTGTKLLLLEGPEPVPGDRHLLDLGCGYGPIALALAVRNPGATVWAVDVNDRARRLCRDNAAAAGLANVEVVGPDEVPDAVVIDRLWSNPPIRIGKQAMRTMLGRWLARLAPTGSAHLVVQKHLGSDSLQRWLDEQGFSTERRRSRAGYRLLDVERGRAAAEGPTGAVDR